MNVVGWTISSVAFIKAYVSPSHRDDCKFSRSSIYDFHMGIELNPRLGKDFDLKLFTNGHLGMMIWTLIDFSNMAFQYQTYGRIDKSLILVTILHILYVGDFYVNEAWYLSTIDIAHDHYGFYLCWGSLVFLPVVYTSQAQYLGMHPTSPSDAYLAITFGTALLGYAMFRAANDQKGYARRLGNQARIWGKPAEFIHASYLTLDGKARASLLLCSGWWGWSRHANYVGDLIFSYSLCAVVGSTKLVVWTYAMFVTAVLAHRCLRDEKRMSAKYGAAWDEYCRRVPWRFVPGIL
ncbi:7-dehydrocholesterol reductase [Echria macrotheca]|uniref:7-dehydrocholesterol reductase n=1 Tax=Echria macrotheca TaxID=438768 RepID=A0AAJ0BH84_9PEZI|nr:7-dehydrocholesterol reductase [Echria macrotheca]